MNILITGGAGYIGSRLAARLASNANVTVVDNLQRGTTMNADIDLRVGDIRSQRLLNKLSQDVDVIFHLAAESSVMTAEANPNNCFSTNVTGTFRVLEAARTNSVKRVVFTSSREVYGESACLPVSESAPLQARNVYGASKAAAEMLCGAYSGEISIARLSNVYGPGDTGRVIPLFVNNAIQGRPLRLFGARQVIDFVWIETVIDALERLGLGSFVAGPLNIASGKGTLITDLAERVRREAGSSSSIEIAAARDSEVVQFVADISAANAYLGIQVPVDPLFGLNDVINVAKQTTRQVAFSLGTHQRFQRLRRVKPSPEPLNAFTYLHVCLSW